MENRPTQIYSMLLDVQCGKNELIPKIRSMVKQIVDVDCYPKNQTKNTIPHWPKYFVNGWIRIIILDLINEKKKLSVCTDHTLHSDT